MSNGDTFIPLFQRPEDPNFIPLFQEQEREIRLRGPEIEPDSATVTLTPSETTDDVIHHQQKRVLDFIAEASGIPAIFRTVTSFGDQLLPGTPLADAWQRVTGKRPREAGIGDVVVAGITVLGGAGLRGATMLLRGTVGTAAKRLTALSDNAITALGRARSLAKTARRGAQEAAELAGREFRPPVSVAEMRQVEDTIRIATEALAANGRIGDPKVTSEVTRIFQYIADHVRMGVVPADELPAVFADYGIKSADEAVELWAAAIEEAATTWGHFGKALSDAKKTLAQVVGKYLTPEMRERLGIRIAEDSIFNKLRTRFLQPLIEIWRGSITAQLATAQRNMEVGLFRMPLQAFDDVAANAARSFSTNTGIRATTVHAMENMTAMWRNTPGRGKELFEQIINQFADPIQRRALASLYWRMGTGPASKATMGFIAKNQRRIINAVQIFNRNQEFWIRRMAFDARFTQRLQQLGLRVDQVVGDSFKALPESVQKQVFKAFGEATEWCLDATFTLTPKKSPILAVYRAIPEAALAHPFPRFLVNSIRFISQHSPLGLARFATRGQRAKILEAVGQEAAGSLAAEALGKMVTGSMLFASGIAIRNSPLAGNKWYQVRIGNRVVDTRPFNPLAAYMLMGEVIKQLADPEATHVKLRPSDYAEAFLGIRRLTGTGLFVFDALALDSPKAFQTSLENFAREFIGGFTIPFRTLKDVIAAPASEDERVYRETREGNIFASAVGNIPFLNRVLPERARAERREPMGVEPPILGAIPTGTLRQLTGISARAETPIERELGRLDIHAAARTGDPKLNRLINEQMSEEVERRLNPLLASRSYERLDDFEKKQRINNVLSRARSRAKRKVLRTEAPRIIDELTEELRGMSVDRIKTELRRRRNAGYITAAMERAILASLTR